MAPDSVWLQPWCQAKEAPTAVLPAFVVRAEEADKLSAGDLRDTQRIPPGGTPSYTVWSARGGWSITPAADLELALENITDVDYRVHGSGSNAPGRNLVVGMRVVF